MAAARATVCQILDDDAYRHIDRLQQMMVEGCESVIRDTGLPAHVVAVGAKGCLVFSPHEVRNYRDHMAIDDRYSHCHWLFQHNGGVFLPPWGKAEQWLLSIQHEAADVSRFLENFSALAEALQGIGISRTTERFQR
jgi:glutamate-1-semialdehyde 2,1-aminomutase